MQFNLKILLTYDVWAFGWRGESFGNILFSKDVNLLEGKGKNYKEKFSEKSSIAGEYAQKNIPGRFE